MNLIEAIHRSIIHANKMATRHKAFKTNWIHVELIRTISYSYALACFA